MDVNQYHGKPNFPFAVITGLMAYVIFSRIYISLSCASKMLVMCIMNILYTNTMPVYVIPSDQFLLTKHLYFQIYLDPFEEMGMAARDAEQHRRSATEKEVWKTIVHGL